MWTWIKAFSLGTYIVAGSLMDVIRMGTFLTVGRMIENGENINKEYPNCYTPLMKAVESWNSDIVALLIRSGAHLNKRSSPNGYTALHLATIRKKHDAVGYLVRSGADLDLVDKYGKTALMIAAENGSYEIAALLIEHRAKVDEFNTHGVSALTKAAKNGHTAIVSKLLDAGVDPNSKRRLSALHYTAVWGRTVTMILLISRGAKIGNELSIAVRFGHADAASVLIANGAPVTRDALQEALKKNNNELAAMLLLAGAESRDIISTNDVYRLLSDRIRIPVVSVSRHEGSISKEFQRMDKQTSSVSAGFRDLFRDEARLATVYRIVVSLKLLDCDNLSFHYLVAPFLIEDSADWDRLNRFQVVLSFLGSAALDSDEISHTKRFLLQTIRRSAVVKIEVLIDALYAAYKKAEGNDGEKAMKLEKKFNDKLFRPARLIKSYAPSCDYIPLLMQYASSGYTQGVMNALEQGCPVNQVRMSSGDTPLTLAARGGHLDVVRVLIDNGADLNHEAVRSGGSALAIAAARGFIEIVSLLIQSNADVFMSSSAARSGKIVAMLLDEGVDVNYIFPQVGCSALMLAAANGHVDTMRFLLSKGADIAAVSKDGNTPLMFAVRSGQEEAARLLIANGADISLVSLNSAPRGSRDMIRMLIHAGAVIAKVDSDLLYASDIAPILVSWSRVSDRDIPPRFSVIIDAFLNLKNDPNREDYKSYHVLYELYFDESSHLFNEWWADESRIRRISLIISFLVELGCRDETFYLFSPFLAESDVRSLNRFGVVLKFLLDPLESDIHNADGKKEVIAFNIKTLNESMQKADNVRPAKIVEVMFARYNEVHAEMAILKRVMRIIPDVNIGGVLRFANGPFGIYSKFAQSLDSST